MTTIDFRLNAILLAATLLGAACLEVEEPMSGAEEDGEAALPAPTLWRVTPPRLAPDAEERQREVDHYIADQLYDGYEIVETTQMYSGDLVDWVDPDSVPGSNVEPPPPIPASELVTPPGVELQRTELDDHPELRGPEGTIPFVRPRFADYVRGDSGDATLGDYLARGASGQLYGLNRLYAGYYKTVPNTMVAGYVDNLVGQVDWGTFSLIEVATHCPGPDEPRTGELVGAVVSKDMANFYDDLLRVRVEFYSRGRGIGGWDGRAAGFVAAIGRPYGPNTPVTQSVVGSSQYESFFKIQNYGGNWWIAHNGNWLGYYPGSLFNLIRYQSCKAAWYGEVYDPTPTDWTTTDMGSGYYAAAGFRRAAYVRDPYYASATGSWWADGAIVMGPTDAACYTDTSMFSGAAPWERYFYLGGPGGNAWNCY